MRTTALTHLNAQVALVLLLALQVSGCGVGPGYSAQKSGRRSYYSSITAVQPATPIVDETGGNIGSPKPSPSPSPTPTAALQTFQIHGVGLTAVSIKVKANRMLRVRFTPGQQDSVVAGTSTKPLYSRLGAYITVNGFSQVTGMLNNGLRLPAESATVDLRGTFPTSCGEDAACRQEVTISVSNPSYDFYCLTYGTLCPHSLVVSTHPWNATLEVQTDDTVAIP
jgi:hypothetical protein